MAALTAFSGALYAITNNSYGNGMQVRRTTDGANWTLAAPAGFGDSNNWGPYWGNSVTVANNRLYIDTINNANGAEIWVKTLSADFTATPTRGAPPLTVQFTNTSGGDFTTSLWNFGDGGTSTATSPMHTYMASGTYTVTLTIGDGADTNTVRKPSCIIVKQAVYLPLITRP